MPRNASRSPRYSAQPVSSSDGQHFPTAGPGEAVGAVNAHYERAASALFYTHLSARQAPYHTVAIPPSGEAAYVIDGLLYHEADLSIATHHTDGGGVSDHVFALAYLLGFHFAPRIPNLAERRLYTFGASTGSEYRITRPSDVISTRASGYASIARRIDWRKVSLNFDANSPALPVPNWAIRSRHVRIAVSCRLNIGSR
jgi:TnpA family transposase